jgi:hypothetical protein
MFFFIFIYETIYRHKNNHAFYLYFSVTKKFQKVKRESKNGHFSKSKNVQF